MEKDEDYISDIVECKISRVALRRDGILHIDIQPEQHFAITDFRELMDAAFRIGNGKKFLNLITVGKYTIPDHETRIMSTSKDGSSYKYADAFVINSLPQKLVGNFYMRFYTPFVPTRFFNSQSEALKWLKKQKVIKEHPAL